MSCGRMNDGQRSDIQSDDRSDNQWVSFVELATRRGISKEAAHRLVRRKGWRRQSDNRGRVLVLVPVEELAQAEVGRPANQSDSPPDNRSDTEAMFQVALQAKDAEIAAKDAAIEAKDMLVTELRAGLDQARAEVTELRMEIAAGAIALEQAEAAARAAEERAERLEAADAERRGQGRWARLRAAWRSDWDHHVVMREG
jgi:uncharacterized protein involved in type VI secretion and phage assembly